MGNTYLNAGVRVSILGGVDRSIYPRKIGNATLEEEYANLVSSDTAATIGFRLMVLRPRGVRGVATSSRGLSSVEVCIPRHMALLFQLIYHACWFTDQDSNPMRPIKVNILPIREQHP